MADLKSLEKEELIRYLKEQSLPGYRASQVFDWMHRKKVSSIDEMTNLPLSLRDKLRENNNFTVLSPVQVLTSKIDGTKKYLFALQDGNVIESVLMRYRYGNSVCISSQVGCRMGCRFCASTLDGRIRNLTAAEMLEQVYRIETDIGERVSHVVVMGSGEPLDNYESLIRFIRLICDEDGANLSQRNITVSTCGLVEKIRELAQEKLAITLALSLHAPDQARREQLMPIAKKYEIYDVLDACRYYFEMTGRRVSYEYSLVAGVNDSLQEADKLAGLLKKYPGHVNLIPVNPVKETRMRRPAMKNVSAFRDRLAGKGLTVTVRRELGSDIAGACGQLRRSYASS